MIYRGIPDDSAELISLSCDAVDVFGQVQLLFRLQLSPSRCLEPGDTHLLQALHVILFRKGVHGDAQFRRVEAALLGLIRMLLAVVVARFDDRCFCPVESIHIVHHMLYQDLVFFLELHNVGRCLLFKDYIRQALPVLE